MGVRNLETSLNHLMTTLPDFQEEETLLQFHARKLGYLVDRTPKCHPELAGEGVEYAWGAAKLYYRRQPLSDKRSKDKFMMLVERSISRDTVLTIQNIRQFSARARRYMIAYLAIEKAKQQEEIQANGDEIRVKHENLTHDVIEKCVKHFKCHRNASDFDSAFIKRIVDEMYKIK